MQRLEDLAAAPNRRLFYQHFAEALTRGEVEAVLVEMTPESSGGPAGPGGMGRRPPGPAGKPALPGGGDPRLTPPARGMQGRVVPFDKAVPLTRERFLALVSDPAEQPEPMKR